MIPFSVFLLGIKSQKVVFAIEVGVVRILPELRITPGADETFQLYGIHARSPIYGISLSIMTTYASDLSALFPYIPSRKGKLARWKLCACKGEDVQISRVLIPKVKNGWNLVKIEAVGADSPAVRNPSPVSIIANPSDSRFRQGQGVATLMGNHDAVTRVYAATGRLCLCHHLRPRVGAKHSCNQIRNALTGQDSDKTNGMLAATLEDWTRGTCLGLAATKTQGLTSLDK